MKTKLFTARKFDGDDKYSWAVFYSKDVKGKGMQIFYGMARPVCVGMCRDEAERMAIRLDAEHAARETV